MKQAIELTSCMGTELTQNTDKNVSGGEVHEHGTESYGKYGEVTWMLMYDSELWSQMT